MALDPVLVTGSSGLVGYRVAKRLHEVGVDVLGVDVDPEATPFPAVVGDVTDIAAMRALLQGRPNVVHAGAVSGPMLMREDPHGIARINVGGAISVFEACMRARVRRLVWLSSIAVYGDQPTLDPIPESTAPNPISFYGHTKLAGEVLLRAYATQYGLRAVALRLSSVFGVRRRTDYGIRAVIEAALAGRPVTVPAAQTSFRQYLHVDDAADAVVLALSADDLHEPAYNITGGTYVTEAELAAMLGALLPGLVTVAGPAAWTEGHLGPLEIEAAARDLGYRPRVRLADGIEEIVAALTQHARASAPGLSREAGQS